MKTELFPLSSPLPSLFQIAAFFEELFPTGTSKPPVPEPNPFPLADWKLTPEKLITLLRERKTGETAGTIEKKGPPSRKRMSRNGSSRKHSLANRERIAPVSLHDIDRLPTNGQGANGRAAEGPLGVLPKKVEFIYAAPAATSVKLAGDFTDWERRAIEMMHSDGVWFTVVPLEPGTYTYRFIVDGRWCDAPDVNQRVPNPFGTQNAVIEVS